MKCRTEKRRHKAGRIFLLLLFLFIIMAVVYFTISAVFGPDQRSDSVQTAGTEHGWNLILVNSDYKIPEDWEVELTRLSNSQRVDSRIYPYLQKMFDDMRAQGIYPVVGSGYRTAQKQKALMEDKIRDFLLQGCSRSKAKAEARKWVSEVGCSEHQTGLAVDINADGVKSSGDQVYRWLAENAWRYGFIQRYPADKTEITGIDYEPWHYRYVGSTAAEEIYREGICLEEYIRCLE